MDLERDAGPDEGRSGTRWLLLAAAAAFVAWAFLFIYRTSFVGVDGRRYFSLFDDAMISMRYAWNLSHGLGLVWNSGEPVEGYTNLLMVLVMALATAAFDRVGAVLAIQVSGIVIALATAFLAMRLFAAVRSRRNNSGATPGMILVFLATLSYYPLTYFSLMGMETGLLSVLTLLSVLAAFAYTRHPSTRLAIYVGTAGALSFLARPDSLIFTTLILGYLWSLRRSWSTYRAWKLDLALCVGVLCLVVLSQRLFALAYYGSIVPNTYLLRVGGVPLAARLLGGLRFVRPYLGQSLPLLVLSGLEMLFDARPGKALLGGLGLSAVLYQVWVGGDPWPYWRIMAAVAPMLIILAAVSLEELGYALGKTSFWAQYGQRHSLLPSGRMASVIRGLAFLGVMYAVNRPFAGEIVGAQAPYQVTSNRANVDTAIALQAVTSSDATVGVFWAGAIPYYTGRPAVDFLGKSDPWVAALPPNLQGGISWSVISTVPGHNKFDLEYSIRSLQPTYVQGLSWGTQDLSQWGAEHYVEVTYRGVSLLLRRGSPDVLWDLVEYP